MTTYAEPGRTMRASPYLRARGPCDRTACALAAGMIDRLLPALAGRRTLDQTGARVTGPVAGLIHAVRGSNPLGGPNYRVRSVHACQTTPHKVEACAVVATARRVRALVMRIEQEDTVWSCTMLAVV
jgi:hypothetical protein